MQIDEKKFNFLKIWKYRRHFFLRNDILKFPTLFAGFWIQSFLENILLWQYSDEPKMPKMDPDELLKLLE